MSEGIPEIRFRVIVVFPSGARTVALENVGFETASQIQQAMSEQASSTGDADLRATAILAYERAMESATKGGRPDVARVAQMRAYDLKQSK